MIIKISNTRTQVELIKGHCFIYILGGGYVDVNENFMIDIVNIETKVPVILRPKLRIADRVRGKRAVRFYDMIVNDTGIHEVSFHNFEDMVIEHNHPLVGMFSWKNLFGGSPKITEREIAIERH